MGDVPDEIEDYNHQIKTVCTYYFSPTEQDYITFPDPVDPTDESISEVVIELEGITPPYWRSEVLDRYFENDELWKKHFQKMYLLIKKANMRYMVTKDNVGDETHFIPKVIVQLFDSYNFIELRDALLTIEGIKDVRPLTEEDL